MKYTNPKFFILAAAAAALLSPEAANAESPDKKNPLSGQEVIQIYSGNTWIWSKGGSYWGNGGSFEAIWNESVGVGKWYATNKGNLCYEAMWKREASDEGSQIKRCWLHVRDSKGVLWKKDDKEKSWYRAGKELDERVKPGNKIKSEVRKRRKVAGL